VQSPFVEQPGKHTNPLPVDAHELGTPTLLLPQLVSLEDEQFA
jgi:hypothetical protein